LGDPAIRRLRPAGVTACGSTYSDAEPTRTTLESSARIVHARVVACASPDRAIWPYISDVMQDEESSSTARGSIVVDKFRGIVEYASVG
jgi:hypothetical protein